MPSDKIIQIWKDKKMYDKLREHNISFEEEIIKNNVLQEQKSIIKEVLQPSVSLPLNKMLSLRLNDKHIAILNNLKQNNEDVSSVIRRLIIKNGGLT